MPARSRFPALIAAAAAGALAVYVFGGSRAPAPRADLVAASAPAPAATTSAPVAVQLVDVGIMSDTDRLRLGGTVEPARTVHLAAQAPGRIAYVAGDEGTKIAEGALVIGLDDGGLTARYNAALADLASQTAGLENARVQLWQRLYGPTTPPMGGAPQAGAEQMVTPAYNMAQSFFGMVPGMGGLGGPIQTTAQSQRNWATASAAQYDYQRQAAALAVAQSNVDELAAEFRDRRAIAPWSGVMLKRFVREGDVVQPGQPLADLADMSNLSIRVEVPVALMPGLKLGDPVPVTIEGNNLWAPVAQIFPAATEGAHTVTVKLSLPADTPAAPGMYALAWLAQPGGGGPNKTSPSVPTAAITWRGSLPVAFIADADGRAEMRVLRLGDAQSDRTAVLSGLEAGDHVVGAPTATLKSGDVLQVQP